jgi:hypothetical protein
MGNLNPVRNSCNKTVGITGLPPAGCDLCDLVFVYQLYAQDVIAPRQNPLFRHRDRKSIGTHEGLGHLVEAFNLDSVNARSA